MVLNFVARADLSAGLLLYISCSVKLGIKTLQTLQTKLNALLGKLDAFKIRLSIFQIAMSFVHIGQHFGQGKFCVTLSERLFFTASH